MGGWASRVGDFEASQYDYYYDELITESANRIDIESQKVIIDVKHIPTGKTWQYEVPVAEVDSIDCNRDTDGETWILSTKHLGLRDWLFNRLRKAGKPIFIKPVLNVNNCSIEYYLQSPIGDSRVIVGIEPKQYEITELWHFEWLGDHGFIYAF